MNIVNRKVADKSINVVDAVSIGEEMALDFVKSLPDGFHNRLKNRVKTMDTMQRGVVVGENKLYDMEALFSRLLIVGLSRNINLATVFGYELCAVPPSIIAEFGILRKGSKAQLVKSSGCCNKIVMEPRSQHRPIGVQVNAAITVQTVPFRRRLNLNKANWEQYAYQLDAAVENIPATAECYDQFVKALRKVARKNIPRGCRRNYVPGLTPESIELIEEYREKYEDDPFADSTITIGEELMSAISQRNAVNHRRP